MTARTPQDPAAEAPRPRRVARAFVPGEPAAAPPPRTAAAGGKTSGQARADVAEDAVRMSAEDGADLSCWVAECIRAEITRRAGQSESGAA